jgi:hypothetical protein
MKNHTEIPEEAKLAISRASASEHGEAIRGRKFSAGSPSPHPACGHPLPSDGRGATGESPVLPLPFEAHRLWAFHFHDDSEERQGILPDERVGRGERQAVRLRMKSSQANLAIRASISSIRAGRFG